jgi:hypothetical protein
MGKQRRRIGRPRDASCNSPAGALLSSSLAAVVPSRRTNSYRFLTEQSDVEACDYGAFRARTVVSGNGDAARPWQPATNPRASRHRNDFRREIAARTVRRTNAKMELTAANENTIGQRKNRLRFRNRAARIRE